MALRVNTTWMQAGGGGQHRPSILSHTPGCWLTLPSRPANRAATAAAEGAIIAAAASHGIDGKLLQWMDTAA